MRVQDTSLEAHESIKPTAAVKRMAIHGLVAGYAPHGRTCEEIERELGWDHQGTSARVNELMRAGLLESRNDLRRVNLTGKSAIVWFAVPENLAVPRERVETPIRRAAKDMYAHLARIAAAKGDTAALARLAEGTRAVLDAADKILYPVSKSVQAKGRKAEAARRKAEGSAKPAEEGREAAADAGAAPHAVPVGPIPALPHPSSPAPDHAAGAR